MKGNRRAGAVLRIQPARQRLASKESSADIRPEFSGKIGCDRDSDAAGSCPQSKAGIERLLSPLLGNERSRVVRYKAAVSGHQAAIPAANHKGADCGVLRAAPDAGLMGQL